MESLKLTRGKLLIICLTVLGIVFIAATVFKVSIGNLFFFAVLLACPLMHFFMMKGHGQHEKKDDTKQTGKSCH